MKKIKIAIIGAGLMGKKRADAIKNIKECELKSIFDISKKASYEFSKKYNCKINKNIGEILNDPEINLVILAINHKEAANLAPQILKNHNLLIEKPLGRNLIEAKNIVNSAKKYAHKLFVGFNYHYYPHIQLAKLYIKKGKLGEIISSTFKIGHAAFPGYEKTWKMDKELCGGGVILDPGIHLIDLMLSFFGNPISYQAKMNSLGWKSSVEDEVLITFIFTNKTLSAHHYSLNFAKNIFIIEFIGTKGIIRLGGRGGNYGNMTFEYTPRWFWKTGSKIIRKDFDNIDKSFEEELRDIAKKIIEPKSLFNYENYLQSMKILSSMYNSSIN